MPQTTAVCNGYLTVGYNSDVLEKGQVLRITQRFLSGSPSWRGTGVNSKTLQEYWRDVLGRKHPGAQPVLLQLQQGFPEHPKIRPVCQKLIRCFNLLEGKLILMGSLADSTWTGYSDLDGLYIAPDQELLERMEEIKRALTCASRVALEFDHLQHHGLFVMPETAAENFSLLPPSALDKARMLKGHGPVRIGGWETGPDVVISFINKCLRVGQNKRARPKNLYQLKLLLSQISLMPTLFYRAKGLDLTKPQAIERFGREFPWAFGAIRTASEIRLWWQRPDKTWFKLGVRVWPNPWQFAALANLSFGIDQPIREELNHNFYSEVQKLGETIGNALDR